MAEVVHGHDDPFVGAVQAIFDVVQRHCPNFRASLLGYRALSPADLESEFGLVGGDISHGVSLDQLPGARPLLGLAAYRSPIGLYHCSAGLHPGGSVASAPA
jgi:phytoene dehydrogenase-like protein